MRTTGSVAAVLIIMAITCGCQREGAQPTGPSPAPEMSLTDARTVNSFDSPCDPWSGRWGKPPDPDAIGRHAQEMLDANGFVVLPGHAIFSLTGAIRAQRPYITCDSILYVLGSLFRGGISEYERQKLRPLLVEFAEQGLGAAKSDWRSYREGPLAEPARRNLVLFGVAHALLGGDPPEPVADDVRLITGKIIEARETSVYPGEDYTIYRIRGAYENHPALAGYSRTRKWLSRYLMPLVPGVESADESDLRLRQAVLLGRMMQSDDVMGSAWRSWREASADFIGPPTRSRRPRSPKEPIARSHRAMPQARVPNSPTTERCRCCAPNSLPIATTRRA